MIAWEVMAPLTAVAFMAGFFDAIAGGGGLITLPALFLAGINPIAAIATNKFQASAATISATIAFARKGLVEWRTGRYLILCAFLGGASGAFLVSQFNKSYLEMSVPILLILVATYFAFAPKMIDADKKERISITVFSFLIAPLLGFYDGVFGPGTGSFLMVGLVLLCGLPLMRAMSFTKLANAASNLGALFVFIAKGAIVWPIAISMAIGAFLGAQLGARFAVRFGSRLIRPMVVIVCCALALRLGFMETNPLHIFIRNFFYGS